MFRLSIPFFCFVFLASFSLAQERAKRTVDDKELPKPTRKITYKQIGAKPLQLHVFDPLESSASNDTKPAIVFFFGGGWTSGDPKQFYTQCRLLADNGVLAMSAEYRVKSRDDSKVIDSIADAQDAIAYVRSHAKELKVDPQRIAAGGGSAGGHLAAATATLAYRGTESNRSDLDYRPDALILFNPALVLAPTHTEHDKELEALRRNLVDRVGDAPESASPYHHLKKDMPPSIIFHGLADTTVPHWTVELFQRKAKELGSDCRLKSYEGEAHGFFNFGRAKYQTVRDAMVEFLRDIHYVK